MKTKTTNVALIALIMMFTFINRTSAKGGDSGRFSIGAEVALPTGDDADYYSAALGGSVRYEMPVSDAIGLTGTVGYLSYLLKGDFSGTGISLSSIPILIGGKYYFSGNHFEGFYGMVNLGLTLTTAKVEFLGVTESSSSSAFTFGPTIGYHLENLDFGASYNIVSASGNSSGYIGLRLAYVLGEK